VNGHRGRIHRPVQHSYDDFGTSLGDGPQPLEAGQPGNQFGCDITLGHDAKSRYKLGIENMRIGLIIDQM
jgi:hypothetical protein